MKHPLVWKLSIAAVVGNVALACSDQPAGDPLPSDAAGGTAGASGGAAEASGGAADSHGGAAGADTRDEAETVLSVLEGGGLAPEPSSSPLEQVGEPTEEGLEYPDGSSWKCTTTQYSLADDPEQFVSLAPSAAVVWPGSLVQGKTLASGSPEPIALERGPGTIVMNLLNSGNGIAKSYQAHLDEVTQGNVIDAQNQILANNVGSTPALFAFQAEQVDSESQLALALNVDVSWLQGDVGTSLGFTKDTHYTRFVVSLTQQYYTMVFETPTSPQNLFSESVTAEEIGRYVQEGNPATYVSSVTYGRQIFLLVESTSSKQDLSAALAMSYDGGFAKASADARATFDQTEEQTRIKAYVVGGAADAALNGVLSADKNRLEALHDYLVDGASFSAESPGLPISYTVRNVLDNSLVKMALTSNYSTQTCVPVVKADSRLVLWLDANDIAAQNPSVSDNGPFTVWNGKSQNANNAQDGQASYYATGLNGHPAASFTGTNGPSPGSPGSFDIDLGSGILAGNDYTFVAVVRSIGTPNKSFFVHAKNGTWQSDSNFHLGWNDATKLVFAQYSHDLEADVAPQATGDVIVARASAKTGKCLFVNGVMRRCEPDNTAPLVANPGSQLGGVTQWQSECPGGINGCQVKHWFEGLIGEVRAYNYALLNSERAVVECELAKAWDIPVAGCTDGKPDAAGASY